MTALGGNFYYTITPQIKFGLGLPKELGIQGRIFSTAGTLTTIDTNSTNYYDEGSLRVYIWSWRIMAISIWSN